MSMSLVAKPGASFVRSVAMTKWPATEAFAK
jgi:hypothetical protein